MKENIRVILQKGNKRRFLHLKRRNFRNIERTTLDIIIFLENYTKKVKMKAMDVEF